MLWCLACFIVGMTVGASLLVLLILAGTLSQRREGD